MFARRLEQARHEVLQHEKHELSYRTRIELLRLLGPVDHTKEFPMGEGKRRRIQLAVRVATKVVPAWKRDFQTNALEELLSSIDQCLAGTRSVALVRQETDALRGGLDNDHHGKDQAYLAGRAANQVGWVCVFDEILEPDEGITEEELYRREDPDQFDCAFFAACSWANGLPNGVHFDSHAYREFWLWYLNALGEVAIQLKDIEPSATDLAAQNSLFATRLLFLSQGFSDKVKSEIQRLIQSDGAETVRDERPLLFELLVRVLEDGATGERDALIDFQQHMSAEKLNVMEHNLALAQLANLAGNAEAKEQRALRSLELHEHASQLLSPNGTAPGAQSSYEEVATLSYALAQRIRRLVSLNRFEESISLVNAFSTFPQLTTNGRARNRFWEATLLTANGLMDEAQFSSALELTQRALTLSTFEGTEYTFLAQLQLLAASALAARKSNRLDIAHDACVRVVSLKHADLTENEYDEVSWALLEGAYIGKLRKRTDDTTFFLDALDTLAPLHPDDTTYSAILRAEVAIAKSDFSHAEKHLAPLHTFGLPWIEAAFYAARARLDFSRGEISSAKVWAKRVLSDFETADDCQEAVQFARQLLEGHNTN
jgi:hypothetical protein